MTVNRCTQGKRHQQRTGCNIMHKAQPSKLRPGQSNVGWVLFYMKLQPGTSILQRLWLTWWIHFGSCYSLCHEACVWGLKHCMLRPGFSAERLRIYIRCEEGVPRRRYTSQCGQSPTVTSKKEKAWANIRCWLDTGPVLARIGPVPSQQQMFAGILPSSSKRERCKCPKSESRPRGLAITKQNITVSINLSTDASINKSPVSLMSSTVNLWQRKTERKQEAPQIRSDQIN